MRKNVNISTSKYFATKNKIRQKLPRISVKKLSTGSKKIAPQ